VPASRFGFEITETAAVANFSAAVRLIQQVRALGCSFALDDFGSGLSSFAYLKHLPVDVLKIDGSFVRGIATDPIDRAMVASIHEIGHLMGLRTTAEFVENSDVLEELSSIGVDLAQGYALGRPMPLEDCLALTRG
jgi:EAL domain-containing protein (putative c-di-GMP-specific phosphodiesterase class I)